MANNTVHVTFKVNSDGSLQQVSNQANKAAAGLKKATEGTVEYNRAARGVANLQQNQTKAFAATARGTSGLVAAYATLMANVFALTAAFGALQRAAALEQLEKGLVAVGNAAGQNLPYVAREIQNITGQAVTLQEAMEGTALAMSAGFGVDQLKELTKVARGASIALGRNMGDALTRLVKGTAKLEPEILDELGILVRIDKAAQDYAASLGKTANQLTRFEKQQAFLNATIEQGQKKFSVVLDSIDPDPYSKLGAAFQDLVKDITTFMNKGLIPVVDFLSTSKFAMTGALLLFGSSITRVLLPALSDLSAANRESAAVGAAEAKKASLVISSQYSKAVKSVNAQFKTVPPSIRAVEAEFRAGTLTIDQYRLHLRNLMKSEKLRDAAVKAQGANASAQKKKELAEVRALIAETQRLVALENQRMTLSSAGMLAKKSSKLSKRQSIYQGKMGDAGVKDAFKIAGRGAKAHFKDVGKATDITNKFKLALEASAKSASLFGTAFLKMIPWIGWIMTGVSILGPMFSDLFTKSKVAQAAEEVTDSFKSFVDISSQLTTELEKTDSLFEKTNKQLAVRVGLLDQVAAGISKVIKAEEEAEAENAKEALEEVIAARETLNRLEGIEAYNNTNILTGARVRLAKAEEEYAAILKSTQTVSAAQAQQILAEAQATIKATGLTEVFGNELGKLNQIKQKLASGESITAQDLLGQVADIVRPAKALKAAQEEAVEATIKLENQLKSNIEKASGQFGELFINVNGLKNALEDVAAKAAQTETKNIELITPEQTKEVLRLAKALDVAIVKTDKFNDETGKFEGEVLDHLSVLEEVSRQIAKNNKLASTSVEVARGLNKSAKDFGTISKANQFALRIQLELQQEANRVTLEGLNAKLKTLLATEGENSVSKEVLQLKEQILNAEREIRKESEFETQITIASLEHSKRKNDLLMKQVGFSQKIADNVAKQARMELELTRAKTGRKLSARDETRLLVEAETKNKKIREEKLALEKKKINIEYDLMYQQFELEKIRISRLVREENLVRQQTIADKLASGDLFDADAKDPLHKIKAAKAELDKLQSGAVSDAMIAQLQAPIIQLQNLINGTPDAVDSVTGAVSAGTEGLRQSALNAADSDSNAGGQAAGHAIDMSQEKEKEEAIKRRMDLHGNFGKIQLENQQNIANAQKHFNDVMNDPVATDEERSRAKADLIVAYGQSVKATSMEIASAMRAIGPEGELMGATMEATGNIAETFTSAFAIIGDGAASMSEKVQAGLAAGMAIAQGFAAIQKASSDAKIKGIDQEIAAEKKRDGKSAASLAKLQGLEKKKELAKRKAFEQEKKAKMAQTVIATAQGITTMLGSAPPPVNFVLAGLVAAMGAKQLSAISSSSYQGAGSAASAGGPSKISMGSRQNSVDLAKGGSQSGELQYARGGSGMGGMSNFVPAFSGYKNRASGGPAGFVVGEQGPELFVPEVPGNIVPAGDANNMQAPTNVNFSIQAVDAAGVEELLSTQRGNIIRMIREAANQQGELFLETVSETQL